MKKSRNRKPGAGRVLASLTAILFAAALAPLSAGADLGMSPEMMAEIRQAEAAGRWDEVTERYREYLEENPLDAALWTRLAEIEAQRGYPNRGLEALEKAAAAAPDDDILQARLSQHYAIADRPAEALSAMEKALALDPDNRDYLLARAQLANWVGRPDLAARSYERLLELEPGEQEALLFLARSRSWNKQLDAAARGYRNYLDAYPDDAGAWREYARVSMWQGNFARAEELIERYREVSDDQPGADRERARLLASADKPKAARELNDPLLAADLDSFELNVTRLIALSYGDQPAAALDQAELVTRLRPESDEAAGLRNFVRAPLRSDVSGRVRYYKDRDDLKILELAAGGGWQFRPDTRLFGGVEAVELRAPIGSGLENIDGSKSARYYKAWGGLRHQLIPELALEGRAGGAEIVDGDNEFIYTLAAGVRPLDSLRVSLSQERDFVLISPRSASLDIKRSTSQGEIVWQPGFLYTVVAVARYDDFTDGNQRWEGILAPRRSVIRGEFLNLDLGVRGTFFGYTEDLDSGYWDPTNYQQYAGTAFAYWKISEQTGLGLIGAAGYFRDSDRSSFEFGWSLDAEVTIGAFSDWMVKISGHAMENFRDIVAAPESFQAYAASLSLTRRF